MPTQGERRSRARDLGLINGVLTPGPHNAITDIDGVRVGHTTLIEGSGAHVAGSGPVRTGVTAVLPRSGDVFEDRVVGGGFVLNGAGEVAGLTQILEWGVIETPILLTNTLSVGTCAEATVQHMIDANPEIGRDAGVIIPVVGECDDSWLNDIAGGHVIPDHVFSAIDEATGGLVDEGSVGGGTGMMTCGFKSGIGTSSRLVARPDGTHFTVGVLVMSNFGMMADLIIAGVPVGRMLAPQYAGVETRIHTDGSIISIVGTDAPLSSHQLCRLAKRVALGIGRVGSYGAHTSGEIAIAFSTGNRVPRETESMVYTLELLLDRHLDPLYRAAIEATEEAVVNSLVACDAMDGLDGRIAPALPISQVAEIMERVRQASF
jgi:D-aminopeptidase